MRVGEERTGVAIDRFGSTPYEVHQAGGEDGVVQFSFQNLGSRRDAVKTLMGSIRRSYQHRRDWESQ